MAIVEITVIKDRSQETKNNIMQEFTDTLVKHLDAEPHQVRVVFREVENGAYSVAGKPIFLDHGSD